MHALVTGATGFIGSHLAEALLAAGYDVTCTVRPTSDRRWLRDPRLRTAEGSLLDAEWLDRVLDGVTHVFHVAGVIRATSHEKFRVGNLETARSLARACARRGIERFVHFSSLAAAGPSPDGRPLTEADPCRPVSVYGRTKLAGERAVLALRDRLPVVVIRPPVVYGPRDRGLFELFRIVDAGILPTIGAGKRYSIVHVQDLVEGSLRAAQGPPGQVYYLANEDPVSSGELGALLCRATGRRAVRVHLPDAALFLLADLAALSGLGSMFTPDKAREISKRNWLCSPGRAGEKLGFRSRVPLEAGLADTVRWYRREGWLPPRAGRGTAPASSCG